MTAQDWTVVGVRRGKKPDRFGNIPFYVDFEGQDEGTYWKRKPENEPQVGETYYGEIREGDYSPRFYPEERDESASGPRAQVQSAGGSEGPTSAPQSPGIGGGNLDRRSARIERQHSQEMALRWIAVARLDPSKITMDLVRQKIDWFCADLDNASPQESPAVTKAKAGAVSDGAAPAEATTAQKRAVTNELKGRVAEKHHDELRRAAKAHTKDGASQLIDGLRRMDANALLKRYGITPKSELDDFVDAEDLPPASEVEDTATAAGLTVSDDDDIPF